MTMFQGCFIVNQRRVLTDVSLVGTEIGVVTMLSQRQMADCSIQLGRDSES